MTSSSRPPFPSDPDAPASEEELRQAEALRSALEDPARDHDAAALARALVHAHEPRAVDPPLQRAMVATAVRAHARPRSFPARVSWLNVSVGALALAAAVLLLVWRAPDDSATGSIALRESRSTQPLFQEPFAERGGESARIDRIASARAVDFRDNRFARWDVR